MSFKVFISYSTKDLARAEEVRRLLVRPGCEAFLAEYSLPPGADLNTDIVEAIRSCDLFVLLWSSNAAASEWVPQEIGIAKASDCPIIPIVLHRDAKPAGFLGGTKYLPLYRNPERALAWLQNNVFARAAKKSQTNGLVWLGLGALVAWAVASDKRPRDA